MSGLPMLAGIPVVSVPRFDDRGTVRTSRTHVTNAQYGPVISRYLSQGAGFVRLVRGLNGDIAAVALAEGAVRDTFGRDRLSRAATGAIVSIEGGLYLYKLVARPSPEGFGGDHQPVVCVSPVEAEGWCKLSGGELRLPSREQVIFTLTEGGCRQYMTATGQLFDEATGKRLLHGQLKLRDGQIFVAEEGDPEFNTATCDVEARDEQTGELIYPDGPFGTRWGGNACLWASGDLVFGASCFGRSPRNFEGSIFGQVYPYDRYEDIGFGVVSAQDLNAV